MEILVSILAFLKIVETLFGWGLTIFFISVYLFIYYQENK